MFDIRKGDDGILYFSGRLDASQVEAAEEMLAGTTGLTVADLSALDYISSAGIGVLLKTFKRLTDSGGRLKLVNANPRVKTVFHYAGLNALIPLE
jgi:anti-anti-sigma factor